MPYPARTTVRLAWPGRRGRCAAATSCRWSSRTRASLPPPANVRPPFTLKARGAEFPESGSWRSLRWLPAAIGLTHGRIELRRGAIEALRDRRFVLQAQAEIQGQLLVDLPVILEVPGPVLILGRETAGALRVTPGDAEQHGNRAQRRPEARGGVQRTPAPVVAEVRIGEVAAECRSEKTRYSAKSGPNFREWLPRILVKLPTKLMHQRRSGAVARLRTGSAASCRRCDIGHGRIPSETGSRSAGAKPSEARSKPWLTRCSGKICCVRP